MTLADVIAAMRAVGCSEEQVMAVLGTVEIVDQRQARRERNARYQAKLRRLKTSYKTPKTSYPDTNRVDFIQSVVSKWNETASRYHLPQVIDITAPRQAAIMARAKDLTETYEFPDPSAGFAVLFGRVQSSPFLRGEANGFRCDLDFCVRSSSFTKIMEGRYESGNPTERTPYRGTR